MIEVYVSESTGQEHVIRDMPWPYLKNAAAKAERERPGSPEARALRAELRRRDLADEEARARQESY